MTEKNDLERLRVSNKYKSTPLDYVFWSPPLPCGSLLTCNVWENSRKQIIHTPKKLNLLKDDEALKKQELIQKHNVDQDAIKKQVSQFFYLFKLVR